MISYCDVVMEETSKGRWRLTAYQTRKLILDNIAAKTPEAASQWAENYCSSFGWTFELIPLKKD